MIPWTWPARFDLSMYDSFVVIISNHTLQDFVKDYADFEENIEDLDRRLGNIVCQAFDDCSGTEGAFKVHACT